MKKKITRKTAFDDYEERRFDAYYALAVQAVSDAEQLTDRVRWSPGNWQGWLTAHRFLRKAKRAIYDVEHGPG